jgi:hypothetical protein
MKKTRNRILAIVLFAAAALACSPYLTGCGTTTDQRKQIASALLADGKAILTQAGASLLQSAVQQQIADGKVDWAHTAATVAFSAVSTSNLAQLINDATLGKVPQIASAAATAANNAIVHGASEQDAIQAVASVISATALTQK